MFLRIKKSGKYKYLQIVQIYRQGKKVKQRVLTPLGRLDRLEEKKEIESLIQSLSKFSTNVLLALSSKSKIRSGAKSLIGNKG